MPDKDDLDKLIEFLEFCVEYKKSHPKTHDEERQ